MRIAKISPILSTHSDHEVYEPLTSCIRYFQQYVTNWNDDKKKKIFQSVPRRIPNFPRNPLTDILQEYKRIHLSSRLIYLLTYLRTDLLIYLLTPGARGTAFG